MPKQLKALYNSLKKIIKHFQSSRQTTLYTNHNLDELSRGKGRGELFEIYNIDEISLILHTYNSYNPQTTQGEGVICPYSYSLNSGATI